MQTIRPQSFKVPYPIPRLFMAGSGEEDPAEQPQRQSGAPGKGEDLPYRVEVWSEDHKSVEQTLAMTANGSIGYAAYYEATREYPDRYVVLRHKNRFVARWNPPDG
jgi:hypothetical protein